jgi:hypothetical protein
MKSIVVRQYPRHEIMQIEGGVGKTVMPRVEGANHAKLVMGHVHYGVHELLPGTSSYFTMLRDPVDRVLSLYRFIVSTPQHSLHSRLGDVRLLDFVTGAVAAEEIENGQTRQLAGVTEGSPDRASLALAKRNLLEHFIPVGIVERFDESILLFKRRLRWKMPFYVVKNITDNIMPEKPTAEAIEVIRSRNTLDAELYQFACNLFEKQVRQEGPLFDVEVSAFRLLNMAARVYRSCREWARRPGVDGFRT